MLGSFGDLTLSSVRIQLSSYPTSIPQLRESENYFPYKIVLFIRGSSLMALSLSLEYEEWMAFPLQDIHAQKS
jgi:hypothetical protein